MYNRYINRYSDLDGGSRPFAEDRSERAAPSPLPSAARLKGALDGLLGGRLDTGDLLLILILLLLYLEKEDEEILIILSALIVMSIQS
ncbi:MAG: hypothetical protein K5855_00820 [Oscillospiraceae bacterium]|nr:hypothetical protein [Oscillospiraceae bacterium]